MLFDLVVMLRRLIIIIVFFNNSYWQFNLQSTQHFCDIGYHRLPPPRFNSWFKISYRVIQRLIQHICLSKILYLDVKYMIAHRRRLGAEFLEDGKNSRTKISQFFAILGKN